MIPVLFCDIDGVLNHTGTAGWTDPTVQLVQDPACLHELRRILATVPDLELVITSTWRRSPDRMRLLRRSLDGRRFDTTSVRLNDNPRSDAIRLWLADHTADPFGCLAVLDDDADADLADGSFFLTSPHDGGLTAQVADRVIAHLLHVPAARTLTA